MSLGTRFRISPETTSLKSAVGAAVIGATLLLGSAGVVTAQDASPEASPMASPVAAPTWITDIAIDPALVADGDSTSVGLTQGEILEINVAQFETRPFVVLQTANNTDNGIWMVVFTAPEAFDSATFTIPATVDELPEGVTPYGSYEVAAQAQTAAIFADLAPGTYVVASSAGQAVTFVVTEAAVVDVPDIFETPEGTPAS